MQEAREDGGVDVVAAERAREVVPEIVEFALHERDAEHLKRADPRVRSGSAVRILHGHVPERRQGTFRVCVHIHTRWEGGEGDATVALMGREAGVVG